MTIKYSKDDQNIITLTLDNPYQKQNILDDTFVKVFAEVMAKITNEKELSGVIVSSGKKDFLAGADLEKFFRSTDAKEIFEWVEGFKKLLRQLETLGKPVVAAINGTTLGGGYEMTLACHYRICLNENRIRIGLPEVTLGLLPGGGGTQRLSRLIGIQKSLSIMLEGKRLKPEKALRLGLIHELVENEALLISQAKRWIIEHPESSQPWDKKGFRWPGGDNNNPANAGAWSVAPSMINQKTRGNFPAPHKILSCVYEGAGVDFDTGCRLETRHFASLVAGKVSKNIINALWFQLNGIKKGSSRPQGIEKRKINRVGILGAGMMGAGIAYSSAKSGIDVVLKDVTLAQARQGKDYSQNLCEKALSGGRISREQSETLLNKIKITDQAIDLKECDLIIEAVFEDRALKAKVTKEVEEQIHPDSIFASNTSTLPITGLAEQSSRPENFIGLHFFSPVEKMQLVEIIVGKKTSSPTLARAFDYVLQIGKTPIVVNDSRGFYTSRVFKTYPLEGLALLQEGNSPAAIENAGIQAGMPVGPLAISDEISLSLMHHIGIQEAKDLESEGKPLAEHTGQKVVKKMVEELSRVGKKAGKGFYDYPKGESKFLWEGLTTQFPRSETPLTQKEMILRMMFIQAIETVRCFEEKVVTNAADANIGSIFGWGFAVHKGGTLQYINDYGIQEFVEKSSELAQKYGSRFLPPKLLISMAAERKTFQIGKI